MTRSGARARRTQTHRSDRVFFAIFGGVALLLVFLLVIWLARPDKAFSREDFRVSWSMEPVWETVSPSSEPRADSSNPALEIYLDVSGPVGGFFPPPRAQEELSDFRALVNLVPDLLVQVAGDSDSPVRWYGVAEETRALGSRPDLINAALFKGGGTRLQQALDQMIQGLERGDVAVAALVTDLVATDDLIGAMGAAKALDDWMHSGPVRNGQFGAGLLGVRARYWGVRKAACQGQGELGCWFSEQAQEYRPLREVVKKPFYVLIMGRRLEDVDILGQELLKRTERLELEAKWELLSGASRSRTEETSCQTWKTGEAKEKQFALRRALDGSFKCLQARKVDMVCDLPSGMEKGEWKARASWEGVNAEVQDGKARLTLDCDLLQSKAPVGDLVLKLEGKPGGGWSEQWRDWSATTDERDEDIGRTLRLEEFLEKTWLRPDKITVTSQAILKGKSS